MKPGHGKQKGSAFERKVCASLSLWITNGKKKDCFWRSSMSGGRATVHHTRGQRVRQVGDICAVAPEGTHFCERFFVECKHVRSFNIRRFVYANKGPLANYWRKCVKQAAVHNYNPMLIARENRGPIIVLSYPNVVAIDCIIMRVRHAACDVSLFSKLLAKPYTRAIK